MGKPHKSHVCGREYASHIRSYTVVVLAAVIGNFDGNETCEGLYGGNFTNPIISYVYAEEFRSVSIRKEKNN